MWDYIKLAVLGLIAVLAAIAANYAHDLAYMVNALTVMLAAAATFVWVLRTAGDRLPTPMNEYNDGVVRAGAIATALWGVVGFLVGVVIALQLAFPSLNFEWAQGYLNFGKLRPLHTSAVIFAFGGNALIMSTFGACSPLTSRVYVPGRREPNCGTVLVQRATWRHTDCVGPRVR